VPSPHLSRLVQTLLGFQVDPHEAPWPLPLDNEVLIRVLDLHTVEKMAEGCDGTWRREVETAQEDSVAEDDTPAYD